MTDRDRLARKSRKGLECWCLIETPTHGGGVNPHCPQHGPSLDEDRLARAARKHVRDEQAAWDARGERGVIHVCDFTEHGRCVAAIAKAYREDTDA